MSVEEGREGEKVPTWTRIPLQAAEPLVAEPTPLALAYNDRSTRGLSPGSGDGKGMSSHINQGPTKICSRGHPPWHVEGAEMERTRDWPVEMPDSQCVSELAARVMVASRGSINGHGKWWGKCGRLFLVLDDSHEREGEMFNR